MKKSIITKPKKIINSIISNNNTINNNIDNNVINTAINNNINNNKLFTNNIKLVHNNNSAEIYLDKLGTIHFKLYNNQYFNIININNNKVSNLKLNNELVLANANQLNYNVINTPGIAEPNKSLILNENSEIYNINLLSSKNIKGIILTKNQPNITNIGILENLTSNGNVNIASHNGKNGLHLNGILIRANANELNILSGLLTTTNELNYLSDIKEGIAIPSKVMILDKYNNITNINNINTSTIHGIICTENQPNIKNLGILNNLNIDNNLNIINHNGKNGLYLNNILVKANANELNILSGVKITAKELNKLLGLNILAHELNNLIGLRVSANELNKLIGLKIDANELNHLIGLKTNIYELNLLSGLITTANELNILSGLTVTTNELNILQGLKANTNELNILSGLKAITNELNILQGLKANTNELNILQGLKANTNELNYLSEIQIGIGMPFKALILDSNKNIININNISADYIKGKIITKEQHNITELGILNNLKVNGDIDIISHNTINLGLHLNGILVTASALELNILSGALISTTELNKLFGLKTSTGELNKLYGLKPSTFELNILSGIKTTTEELNILSGIKTTTKELNYLSNIEVGKVCSNKVLIADYNRNIYNLNSISVSNISGLILTSYQPNITKLGILKEFTSYGNVNIASHNGSNLGLQLNGILVKTTAEELNILSGIKITTTELNKLSGLLSTTSDLNKLYNLQASHTELNKLYNLKSTTNELNILSGAIINTDELNILSNLKSNTSELNYLAGIKQGIGSEFKALVLDSNRSISNIYTLSSIYIEGILLTKNQPNITSIGNLTELTVNGNINGVKRLILDELILNGTKIMATAKEINKLSGSKITKNELNYLSDSLIGFATPLKTIVTDSNNDIDGIRNLRILGNPISYNSNWSIIYDNRLKEIINNVDVNQCYNIIKNIKLKYYKWNDLFIKKYQIKNNIQLGWDSNDLKKYLPNSIFNIPINSLKLDDCTLLNTDLIYSNMYGSIQKLIIDKEQLENKCEQLENKCEQLENKCEQLAKKFEQLEKKYYKKL